MIRAKTNSVAAVLVFVLTASTLTGGCGAQRRAEPRVPVDAQLQQFNQTAHAAFHAGHYERAARLFRRTLDRAYLRDEWSAIVDAQWNLAISLAQTQQVDEALVLARQGQGDAARVDPALVADFVYLEARLLFEAGRIDETSQILARWEVDGARPMSSDARQALILLEGLLAVEHGDLAEARQALEVAGDDQDTLLAAVRARLRGRVAMLSDDADAARRHFEHEADLRREQLDYLMMARALAAAGEACASGGDRAAAADRYLRAARSAALLGHDDSAGEWFGLALQNARQTDHAGLQAYCRRVAARYGGRVGAEGGVGSDGEE